MQKRFLVLVILLVAVIAAAGAQQTIRIGYWDGAPWSAAGRESAGRRRRGLLDHHHRPGDEGKHQWVRDLRPCCACSAS